MSESQNEVTARRDVGLKISVKARQHTMIADAAATDGGTDTGPTPHEMLAASLAACTSMTVQMYADRKKWPLKSCDATVRLLKSDSTPPKAVFNVTVSFDGDLDTEQRARLLEIAHRCPVHRVLTGPIEMKVSLV